MLNHGVRLAMTEQWQNWPGATEVRLVVALGASLMPLTSRTHTVRGAAQDPS
jgi:hypothetical protein